MNVIALSYHYALPFLGQFLLIVASLSYIGAIVSQKPKPFARAACLFLGLSYVLLTYAFIISDPTLKIVVDHSSPHTPLAYKIAGVWGGAAGSLHLWVCILSAVGCFLKSNQSLRYFALHMVGFILF
ncbi:MAG: hypothetical protein Q8K36_06350, partial [Alphaproteobacteria bacterium]|nr:hypothetical protein [Alphaproteobacteria bacterium]